MAYYADKLHVSPKYLSAVCKEVSGQTAFDLVNQYVLKNVKYMLQWSPKSIKEIAMELDFPNLSFFGKYVKRYLGVSPKQYREQLSSENHQIRKLNRWLDYYFCIFILCLLFGSESV